MVCMISHLLWFDVLLHTASGSVVVDGLLISLLSTVMTDGCVQIYCLELHVTGHISSRADLATD
jgi:hypothetical protein